MTFKSIATAVFNINPTTLGLSHFWEYFLGMSQSRSLPDCVYQPYFERKRSPNVPSCSGIVMFSETGVVVVVVVALVLHADPFPTLPRPMEQS